MFEANRSKCSPYFYQQCYCFLYGCLNPYSCFTSIFTPSKFTCSLLALMHGPIMESQWWYLLVVVLKFAFSATAVHWTSVWSLFTIDLGDNSCCLPLILLLPFLMPAVSCILLAGERIHCLIIGLSTKSKMYVTKKKQFVRTICILKSRGVDFALLCIVTFLSRNLIFQFMFVPFAALKNYNHSAVAAANMHLPY